MTTMTIPTNVMEQALRYVRDGWYVIPLCWPVDGRCGCPKKHMVEKDIGKAPLLGTNYQCVQSTEDDVRKWWTTWPQANVGILLEPSKLLVIDMDGQAAVHEAERKGLPEGPRVKTGTGCHL